MSEDAQRAEKRVVWRGEITKGNAANEIDGWLADEWGWRIELHGVYDNKERKYVLQGIVGPPPDALRIPAIDDVTESDSDLPAVVP